MKLFVSRRKLHLVKDALLSVLVISAASLLFSCGGGGQTDSQSAAQANLAANSLSQSSAQCSDGPTIAAGMSHIVALKTDGTVAGAGSNLNLQLDFTSSSWTGIKAVAAAYYHTIGLKSDGTVVATGSSYPLDVTTWTGIQAISTSKNLTVGLKSDGTVTAAGTFYGSTKQDVGSWTGIKAVAQGYVHTVGVHQDGTVVTAGYPGYSLSSASTWTGIKVVAAGYYHTVGLKDDGTVVTTPGQNSSYGLLNASKWTGIKAIAANGSQTIGLKDNGTVVAVGNNNNIQLKVATWTGIIAIAAGDNQAVGLKDDGTVVFADNNTTNSQLDVSSLTGIMPPCDGNQDIIPPTTKANVTGKMGNNGWYIGDVQATLTATDNTGGSGVKEIHFGVDSSPEVVVPGNSASTAGVSSASSPIAIDGAHTVTFYAIDNAGNKEAAHKMSINIDTTPPTVTAMVLPSPNANGWNNSDVTVTFVCNDTASGIATCPGPVTVTTEGAGQVITDTAVDKAGNSAKVSVTVNIDKTPPPVPSLKASPDILWPPNHKMVNVLISGLATDGGSGIASTVITVTDEYGLLSPTVAGFGSTIRLESWRKGSDMNGRLYTITAVVSDKAGNKSTGTTTVLVPHDMRDFGKDRDDDERDHDKDHGKHGHHDRHHKSGHDNDDHDGGHRHTADRD